MSKINERILQYLDLKNITRYRFYKITGISNGFLDKDANIGSDKCELIISLFDDINPEWLITGNGNMLRSYINNVSEPSSEYKVKKKEGIPLIPIDALAGSFTLDRQVLECDCDTYVVPTFKNADFLIQVRGDSMSPKYNSGDIVACKKLALDAFFQWNKVYVLDTDQGPLIKRVKPGKNDNTLLIISENLLYEPFELNKEKIHHIALVLGCICLE